MFGHRMPSAMPTTHRGASLSTSLPIKFPDNSLEKAAEDGQSVGVWASASDAGGL